MSTTWPQENLLSSRAAWPRCRAYKLDLVLFSSVVPPGVRSLPEDDAYFFALATRPAQNDSKAGWPLMHGSVATLVCMAGSLETCLQKVPSRCAQPELALLLFVVPKKDCCQLLIFDTREANHHFAPPPCTPLAGSQSLSSLQLQPGTALF